MVVTCLKCVGYDAKWQADLRAWYPAFQADEKRRKEEQAARGKKGKKRATKQQRKSAVVE